MPTDWPKELTDYLWWRGFSWHDFPQPRYVSPGGLACVIRVARPYRGWLWFVTYAGPGDPGIDAVALSDPAEVTEFLREVLDG